MKPQIESSIQILLDLFFSRPRITFEKLKREISLEKIILLGEDEITLKTQNSSYTFKLTDDSLAFDEERFGTLEIYKGGYVIYKNSVSNFWADECGGGFMGWNLSSPDESESNYLFHDEKFTPCFISLAKEYDTIVNS